MADIRIVTYSSTPDPQDVAILNRVADEILRPSFDSDEFPADTSLVDSIAKGQLIAVASKGADLLGAAVADSPNEEGVALFSYLAASPAGRGQGTGATLMDHMLSLWRGHSDVELVLAEVHDPRFHPETETEKPVARIRFYERHGAEVLDLPWIQPAMGLGGARVQDMLLIALHRCGRYDGREIDTGPIRRWALEYYRSSAGESGDRLPEPLERRIGSTDSISVLPLADYAEVVPLA